MAGETIITVVGNLTADPELRYTQNGLPVANFTIASTPRNFDRQANEWKDGNTDFHRVTAWRQLAQNVAETLTKGSRVLVHGDLRQHSWTDKETNQQRSAWEINAESVGAELTWATAKVTRTKASGGIARGEAAPDDPWATASKDRPAGAAAAPAGGYSDEPPF